MADLVYAAGSVLVVVSTLLALSCVVIYSLTAGWWRSPMGRHLFSFMAVLAAGLSLWSVQLLTSGRFAGPTDTHLLWLYVRALAFLAFAWVLSWRLVIIARAQLAERRVRRKEKGS
ncbi:putative phage holin [Nonomuraea aridisoli]|uniref:Uncharacterized protein n=1 Tax=Nonomuraea aridisoli TaxID=2070368 RepID=A0A2W2F4B7_9ACTN|nr:hypothetical protein [Nonomuraea aridisoli]PZG20590.1 hypothetical protein C1J01_08790 [Nonomuraea aridisoli]